MPSLSWRFTSCGQVRINDIFSPMSVNKTVDECMFHPMRFRLHQTPATGPRTIVQLKKPPARAVNRVYMLCHARSKRPSEHFCSHTTLAYLVTKSTVDVKIGS